MAPIRRYLRITKYSVLECRIYLDNPSLAQSWLLHPRDPVLPRIIESIRPLVLPKLLEEKERSRKKSLKKKQIKDVIVEDDFEVSMFLTETSTRHSLLTKHKHFREKVPGMLQSNSSKLISETIVEPFDVDGGEAPAPIRVEDESDEGDIRLADIPLAEPNRKRQRASRESGEREAREESSEGDEVRAEESGSETEAHAQSKRTRGSERLGVGDDEDEDDKKKLAMDVSYEGFAIYGRVLCLVVKKRDKKVSQTSGQARMENWITSTQMPIGEDQ